MAGCGCTDTDCPPLAEAGPQGAQGLAGTNGTNGTNGLDSYTTTSADFVQPAVNSNVTASVLDSRWMAVGQNIFIQGGGYYEVQNVPTDLSVILKNLGTTGNVAPATNVTSGKKTVPAGYNMPEAAMAANTIKCNPTNASASPSNLSIAANQFPARNSTGNIAAKTITDIALAFCALPSIVAILNWLGISSFIQTLLNDANAAAARTTLGLGTSSTKDAGTLNGQVLLLDADNKLPAIDGSALTNVPAAWQTILVFGAATSTNPVAGFMTQADNGYQRMHLPFAGNLRNFYVGGSAFGSLTVYVNGVATSITVSGSGNDYQKDTTHTQTCSAGDYVWVQGTVTNFYATLEFYAA